MSKLYAAVVLVIPAAFVLAGSVVHSQVNEPQVTRIQEARQPLRVAIDLAHNRRWELEWDGLFAYDMANGELLRHVALPGATFAGDRRSAFPDMILSRSGAVIVSSNIQPRLWRVSPMRRFEVQVHDVETSEDAEKDSGFTRLSWGANELTLNATATPVGSEWSIDLTTGRATKTREGTPFALSLPRSRDTRGFPEALAP